MRCVNPVVQWLLVTAAAVIPTTFALTLTGAPNAVSGPIVVLLIGGGALYAAELYKRSNLQ